MGTQRMKQCLLFGLCLVTLAFGIVRAEKTVTVVGSTECADCVEKNIKVEQAFKGLRVAIKCKSANGQYETKGVSQLGKSGNFHVNLPIDLLHEESEGITTLKPSCLAELRDQSNKACPKPDPLTITLASKEKDQHTFTVGQDGKLQILSSICNSETFWPPKWDPFHKKPFFSHPFFSHPFFKKSYPVPTYTPPVPEYKPPTPVPVPVPVPPTPVPVPVPEYKPPTPVPVPEHKPPTPVPVPEYKPPTPVPVPEYKPPTPVPVPEYKPPTPVYEPKPTPEPVHNHPPKPPHNHPPKPPKPTPEPVHPWFQPHPKFGFPPIYKKPHPWTKYFHKKPFFPPADTKN